MQKLINIISLTQFPYKWLLIRLDFFLAKPLMFSRFGLCSTSSTSTDKIMAGISGSRTLSPDVLEAIRTKSYVLRPVVKVRIVFCCENSTKRRFLINSDRESKIESNHFIGPESDRWLCLSVTN